MASTARHPPPDQIDQQHGADHQGDADGRRVEDAQGAAGGARRAAVRPLLYAHPAQGDDARDRFQASAARSARGQEAGRHPGRRRQGTVRGAEQQPVPPGRPVRPGDDVFIAAGRKAAQFVARTRRQLVAEFPYGDTPRYQEARAIAALARDSFLKGEVDEVRIVATRFVNTLTQQAVRSNSCPSAKISSADDQGRAGRGALDDGHDRVRSSSRRRRTCSATCCRTI